MTRRIDGATVELDSDTAERELRRASGIGKVIEAAIDHAGANVLQSLEFELQQARARVAAKWPTSPVAIVGRARKSWQGIQADALVGTLRQRARAQLGLCAGLLQAAIEGYDNRRSWKSFAGLAAQSILRLHGVIDALEVVRDSLDKSVKRAANARRERADEKFELVKDKAITLLKMNPRITRDRAAERIALDIGMSVDRTIKYLTRSKLFAHKAK